MSTLHRESTCQKNHKVNNNADILEASSCPPLWVFVAAIWKCGGPNEEHNCGGLNLEEEDVREIGRFRGTTIFIIYIPSLSGRIFSPR